MPHAYQQAGATVATAAKKNTLERLNGKKASKVDRQHIQAVSLKKASYIIYIYIYLCIDDISRVDL